ncbi:MAG: glycoside hydrolase family 2 TIM barrel-domain containing protein [Bacillota bacterium]
MKLTNYFENFSTNHINTLENRAYYLPKTTDGIEKKVLLSGDDWQFKLYENHLHVPEELKHGASVGYDTIPVPSCWNSLGYEHHHYANVKGPIPFDPPFVPHENTCGAYVKRFDLTKKQCDQTLHLNFEGVDSCYYAWLNGEFVGFSKVSHSTSEFDITKVAKTGENVLSVLVLKWCDGTYLEDQDKFRMSGIFRDVYILERSKSHIRDYTVMTDISETGDGIVEVALHTVGDGSYKMTLQDKAGAVVEAVEGKAEHTFVVKNPDLWNAERPDLYTLLLEGNDETINQIVGIKKIEIKDSVFYINGVAVKLKGVNRHESNPYTGSAIAKEDFLKDIILMKEHNVNAVRTSHYPQAPWVMDYYAKYGFYIMDEADIETHNTFAIFGGGHEMKDYGKEIMEDYSFGLLSNDPICEEAMVDRVQRCFVRDKNNPSVVMWSLGNESGYGVNLEKAATWIKEQDARHIVHYESSIYEMPNHTNDLSNIEVYSRMYPDVEAVYRYCNQEKVNRPFVICEYSHAMGNSSGDLGDYFELLYSEKYFTGAFIWEWCDHGMYLGETAEGKKKFGYGGDFGEFPHDGNFCMDGLVYPDRRPHTSLMEHKNVARPIRCEKISDTVLKFHNKLDFVNAEELYDIQLELYVDQKLKSTEIVSLSIPAKGSAEYQLPFDTKGEDVYVLTKYILKKDDGLLEKGYVAGFDQMMYKEKVWGVERKADAQKLTLEETDFEWIVRSETFLYAFDKFLGVPKIVQFYGNHCIAKPMEYNIWRVPLDNDRRVKMQWFEVGYDRVKTKVYESKMELQGDKAVITFDLCLIPIYLQKIISIKSVWTVSADGILDVKIDGKKDPIFPWIPRFGLRMFLPKEHQAVNYYGYGPHESYIDKKNYCYKALFETTVKEMHEDYIRPQENGSHYGCDFLGIQSDQMKIEIFGANFSANVSNYTQEELQEKAHNYELEESPYTVVCLDGQMSGIGSGSCGPQLVEKYQVAQNELEAEFKFHFKKN